MLFARSRHYDTSVRPPACPRHFISALIVIILTHAAFAQAPLSFEVTSVKTATPDRSRPVNGSRMMGGPGTPDPQQLTYTNVTLEMLFLRAFGLKNFHHLPLPNG
jgi:hypothetical protein